MSRVDPRAYIEAIEKTHQKATQSKASTLKFLKDAGIIPQRKSKSKSKSIIKKSK